jgi:hypothetical protein
MALQSEFSWPQRRLTLICFPQQFFKLAALFGKVFAGPHHNLRIVGKTVCLRNQPTVGIDRGLSIQASGKIPVNPAIPLTIFVSIHFHHPFTGGFTQ